jgi:hypothetical protein
MAGIASIITYVTHIIMYTQSHIYHITRTKNMKLLVNLIYNNLPLSLSPSPSAPHSRPLAGYNLLIGSAGEVEAATVASNFNKKDSFASTLIKVLGFLCI